MDPISFSAKVGLPCKLFCGPDSMLEFPGTAVSIETARLLLDLAKFESSWKPEVGERVRLEIFLPIDWRNARAKCMSFRARVSEVLQITGGLQRLELTFRKPSFKDREGVVFEPPAMKMARDGWEM